MLLALCLALASQEVGCARLRKAIEKDEVEEKEGHELSEEERENQEHLWRVKLTLVGQGVVRTNIEGIPEMSLRCTRDEKAQSGECGPKLLRWKEGQPPLLTARGAKGWKFVRWTTSTLRPNGSIVPTEKVIEPGLRLYLNGMGTRDTGESELLTAYFEQQTDPGFEDTDSVPKK